MKYIVECEKHMKCIYVVDAENDEQCHEKLVNGEVEKKVEIDETDNVCHGFRYGGYAYKSVEKYSGEGDERVICCIEDLCDALGTTIDRIERDMFKYTACGMPISWDENGVTLVGYAEGADCDMPTSVLLFPFTMKEFDSTVEYLEAEADELWHMWNDDEEEEDEE